MHCSLLSTDLGTSLIFGAVVQKFSINREMKTAGCHVKKMLDIMAVL